MRRIRYRKPGSKKTCRNADTGQSGQIMSARRCWRRKANPTMRILTTPWSGNDLPLRHVFFDPGFLYRMRRIRREPLNRRDFLSRHARNRRDARAAVASPLMCTVQAPQSRHAAAELRARHVQRVTQHPEERHLRININGRGFSIQRKSCAHDLLPQLVKYPTTTRHRMESPKIRQRCGIRFRR